jgi:hypothetical protein
MALPAIWWAKDRDPPPTVEVDRIDEVLFVPEFAGGVLHPLDLRIERFTGSLGDLMSQVGDEVFRIAASASPLFLSSVVIDFAPPSFTTTENACAPASHTHL